jgi:hypothetical protein
MGTAALPSAGEKCQEPSNRCVGSDLEVILNIHIVNYFHRVINSSIRMPAILGDGCHMAGSQDLCSSVTSEKALLGSPRTSRLLLYRLPQASVPIVYECSVVLEPL